MAIEQDEFAENLNKIIHDARAPLNNISMQAELVKIVIENNMPPEKAIAALDKIINACQACSLQLEKLKQEGQR